MKGVTPESLPDIDFAPVAEALSTATVSGDTVTRLQGVTIEGNTAYSDEELQEFVRPYIGQKIEIKKIYEAAGQITDKYHKDGYFLSQALVPDQTIADGYYRIRVIEGYVADVLIQGEVGPVESLVRSYLSKIPGSIPGQALDRRTVSALVAGYSRPLDYLDFPFGNWGIGARQMVVQLDRSDLGRWSRSIIGLLTIRGRGSSWVESIVPPSPPLASRLIFWCKIAGMRKIPIYRQP